MRNQNRDHWVWLITYRNLHPTSATFELETSGTTKKKKARKLVSLGGYYEPYIGGSKGWYVIDRRGKDNLQVDRKSRYEVTVQQ